MQHHNTTTTIVGKTIQFNNHAGSGGNDDGSSKDGGKDGGIGGSMFGAKHSAGSRGEERGCYITDADAAVGALSADFDALMAAAARADVADAEQVLDLAVAAGGRVLYPVTEVEPGIRVAEFADCEGNRIAVSSGSA